MVMIPDPSIFRQGAMIDIHKRWMKNTFELPLDPKIATAPCEWATSLPGVGAPPPPAPIAGWFFFEKSQRKMGLWLVYV